MVIYKDFDIEICETPNGHYWYILTDLRTQDWWEDQVIYPTHDGVLDAANKEIDEIRK